MIGAEQLKTEANQLFSKGEYKKALKLYEKCLAFPDTPKDFREIVYRNQAQCYLNLGDNASALEAANCALQICPSDTKALYRRCLAYENMNNLRDALVDVKRLLHMDHKNKTIQALAYRLETSVLSTKEETNSLGGKISSMLNVITQEDPPLNVLSQAINNLVSLVHEMGSMAAERIWSHPSMPALFKLCLSPRQDVVNQTLQLFAALIEHNDSYALQLLQTLTPQYFIGRAFSPEETVSLSMCKFLRRLLEGLTQVKKYQKARESAVKANAKDTSKPQSLIPRNVYPPYKLDQKVKAPVEEMLRQIIRALNSYRLEAAPRDTLLELLTWIVPWETGIDWSKQFIAQEGAIERLLEIAAASCSSLIEKRPCVRATSPTASETAATDTLPELSRGGILKTSANTRLTVACLLSRLYEDLVSDTQRQDFSQQCAHFVLELLTDNLIESKVEAAAVIGTLFCGPFEVGSMLLSREGILEGLLLLTQAENIAYQTVALDTIILATNKKDKCVAIIDQAVPILRNLYKSGHDAIKVRALVGLCKLGALGGADASAQSLAEGSTAVLTKACRRLLLKKPTTAADSSTTMVSAKKQDAKNGGAVDFARVGPLDEANSIRWAVDGLAFLSLNAEVKEVIVHDELLVAAIFKVAEMGLLDAAFPLVSLLANLTNSFEEKEISPEMLELAKYAKQHVPQKHELDALNVVTTRRQLLLDLGLPSCLYNLTTKLATGTAAAQPGIRALISRVYLSVAECVEKRGLLVSAGAGKALLNLALEKNTEDGQLAAAQALAKLTITSDPRITFAGQRSLEVIRPILKLLRIDCTALQNYEGLLALTNLASLDEAHR
ncbi:unnamed protein product [Schistocephalus solidus]|uniref:TPR_REGION domain-containing protein n=1 Tax=Schistocephalus solidus TaxID=70667 RepID=A0A183T8L4_SCHSO|nr:unnamed protein product [Schistocephalus solidus]